MTRITPIQAALKASDRRRQMPDPHKAREHALAMAKLIEAEAIGVLMADGRVVDTIV